jgi:hypothetical protein
MKTLKTGWAVLALVSLLGCLALAETDNDEAMLRQASALTKVAAALESAVALNDAPEGLSEPELLRFATKHDPGMLEPFGGSILRARRVGSLSSVLLCSRDGRIALIEDAGCTARSDTHLWKRVPPVQCEFQLALEMVCSVR